ncbi:hypothetical protein GQ55_6G190200 [Panicum hallii var. hallii]|uniref:Uncharacterized protein n=1 Tax=Panicum hallii var. hallii TaxID=1504633 RepID=A0A2T7D7D0_9POAL|nr:hypothetical protein GQ55_6G190200 [Panicum hallii var. hallii]
MAELCFPRRSPSPLLSPPRRPAALLPRRAAACPDVWYLIANLCSYQLEQEILDFSQGLKTIGIAPDEKASSFS